MVEVQGARGVHRSVVSSLRKAKEPYSDSAFTPLLLNITPLLNIITADPVTLGL